MGWMMNEFILVWVLMVAPSHTDMDVEWFAEEITGTDSIEHCQEMARTYVDEHAWCEPRRDYNG